MLDGMTTLGEISHRLYFRYNKWVNHSQSETLWVQKL